MTKTEGRPANMRLASCGMKCLNSSSVFQINFSAGLTDLCSEIPHERQAQKRYGSLNKTTDTTEQIVWWLESLKILSLYSCCWYSFYLQLLNLSIIMRILNAKPRTRNISMNVTRNVRFVALNSLFFHQTIKNSYYQKNNL